MFYEPCFQLSTKNLQFEESNDDLNQILLYINIQHKIYIYVIEKGTYNL